MSASAKSSERYHARSISLPSRPHPLIPQFDEQLSRLRSTEATSTLSSSIRCKFNGLKDLYNCLDELLQLHLHQRTLRQDCEAKGADDLLDGSLRLLDACGTARDLMTQTKEHVQEIQSVLRRRCCGESAIASEVVKYVNTRKVAKKTIKKCMHDLNIMLHKHSSQTQKNVRNSSISALLRDVEAATAEIFESLLSYMAGPKMKSKKSSWFMVSRPMCQSAASASEFEEADAALDSFKTQKKKTGINTEQVDQLRSRMMKLESTIQDLDEPLEFLFRHIVKARASLLNILSN
ncbi:hypothetical protein Nepgr_018177 [Nepenthes gracilis]|uniref:Uncharacterized protein n=1 Tax=Nepenthes gracilis TaxID=150966 RepID=A0AAD3XU24_NEPGR|nr:hypothetical protein Nepgr_018177 [Nepenthes gracilis]